MHAPRKPPFEPTEAAEASGEEQRASRRELLGLGAAGALVGCAGASSRPAPEHETAPRHADAEGAMAELFADLTDQRAKHAPISDVERAERRARLGRLLAAASIDALLIEPGATLSYLAGVSWGLSERLFGVVVLADGSHFWISPAFEEERALRATRSAPADVVTWNEHEYAFRPLSAALRARGVERVAVEPRARLFVAEELALAHGAENVTSGRAIVRDLRARKDAHELALLRAANELTQRAIAAVAERLRPGLTDAEVGRWVRYAQERQGLTGTWALSLLNEDAALPHGSGTERVLAPGDVVLIDTGGGLHGYQSDITRTWIFGARPEGEVVRVWNAVRDAQKRAFDALRPGPPCAAMDRTAREWIATAGFGEGYATFTHRLGHGIGLEGHEEPYLDGGNELALAPGMTFSDEPGIYLPGRFGVRIEDIVVVTDHGGDHFGAWQASPVAPGGPGS